MPHRADSHHVHCRNTLSNIERALQLTHYELAVALEAENVAETHIQIGYDGPSLADHSMDVNDLAPALLSFAQLLKASNAVLNGERASVRVRVKAGFQPGSFSAAIAIVQSLGEHIKTFLGVESYSALDILALIGFVQSVTGVNLVEVLRWKRGRKVQSSETPDGMRLIVVGEGNTIVSADSDSTIVIPPATARLYKAPGVRRALRKVLGPLHSPGIDEFYVRRGQTEMRIKRDEVVYFDPPFEVEKVLTENRSIVVVQLATVVFMGERRWDLYDGERRFSARIQDPEFLADLAEGRISFAKGDRLRIELLMRQIERDGRIDVAYEVVRVLEHIPGPEQPSLFD